MSQWTWAHFSMTAHAWVFWQDWGLHGSNSVKYATLDTEKFWNRFWTFSSTHAKRIGQGISYWNFFSPSVVEDVFYYSSHLVLQAASADCSYKQKSWTGDFCTKHLSGANVGWYLCRLHLLQILKAHWANNFILDSVLRRQAWKLQTLDSVSRSAIDFVYSLSHVILGASIFLHTYLRY